MSVDKSKTGEAQFARGATYDEVSINGNTGRFYLRKKEDERGEDGKYPKHDLGVGVKLKFDQETGQKIVLETTPFKAVFLKIRRVLSSYNPTTGGARTSEHNGKTEKVVLYGPEKGQREVGIAADLREKYPALHTHQIVYGWLPEEDKVVRLTVKGASLGSNTTAKDVVKFYDYLQTFKGDQSVSQYVTEMWPVQEQGPKEIHFPVDFRRGRELDEEEKARVVALIDSIHEEITHQDAALRDRMGREALSPEVAADTEDDEPQGGIEYPDEEVNPDDIPF